MGKYIILSIISWLSFELPAQSSFTLLPDQKDWPLKNVIQILPDTLGNISYEQASGRMQDAFVPINTLKNYNAIPYNHIWLRVKLINKTPVTDFMLMFDLWDEVLVYYEDQAGQLQMKSTGSKYPLAKRDQNLGRFLYTKVSLEPDSETLFYIRVSQVYALTKNHNYALDFFRRTVVATASHTQDIFFMSSIFFGFAASAILVIGIYNLAIFFYIKDFTYLYFVLFLASWLVNIGLESDFINSVLFPESPVDTTYQAIANFNVAWVYFLLFEKNYLRLSEISKGLNQFIRILILYEILVLLLFVFLLIPAPFAVVSMLLVSTCALYITIHCVWIGFKPGKYFLLAVSAHLITPMIGFLVINRIIEYNLTVEPFAFGVLLQIFLFSFGLAYRFKVMQEEVQAYKEEKQVIIEQQKEMLEKEVKLQTQYIESQKEDIISQRDQLQRALGQLQQAQAKLVESEKMSSLGQLTAGIAHEINNPVNFINANIDTLKENLQDILKVTAPIRELSDENYFEQLRQIQKLKEKYAFEMAVQELDILIQGISEGARRTTYIIQGLRTFSHLDDDKYTLINIHQYLDATLALLQNRFRGRIEIIKHYEANPVIEAYPSKLNQVFMNLISNAIEAIEEQGKIIISTLNQVDDFLQISIRDTGVGMGNEVKNRIYEPFFTTKAIGQGVGLGLSIVYSIIEKHKGQIIVESEPGEGSTFDIRLPREASRGN